VQNFEVMRVKFNIEFVLVKIINKYGPLGYISADLQSLLALSHNWSILNKEAS
jgi:hypothetical protein